jgi:hypothetical protein
VKEKAMKSEMVNEVLSIIEDEVARRPSGIEFEFAYQARVAVDCIRFAIKVIDSPVRNADELQEANFQLLDALDRLQLAERGFLRKFRSRRAGASTDVVEAVNRSSTTAA